MNCDAEAAAPHFKNREEPTVTRVLVIDDDQSVSLAIQAMLARRGCDTVLALDGISGIQAFEASRFDVAIVDIFIPGTDGLKIIKGFLEQKPSTSIVAMTGFQFRNSMSPSLDFLGMAAQIGATSCLRKPFTSQQLSEAINLCLASAFSIDRSDGLRDARQGTTR
jgi:DNA-binding NtrC family response regulator